MVIEDLQQLPLDYLLIQRSMRRRERQAVTKDLTSSSPAIRSLHQLVVKDCSSKGKELTVAKIIM
jgi:hypothetical protein